MYCNNCGRLVDDSSTYCNNCGTRLNTKNEQGYTADGPSFGFALLGFFIPIVGLILFLIYEGKKPKRAKSVGKGALIGFITKIVLTTVFVVFYMVFVASLFSDISNDIQADIPVIDDVSFGEFKITNNGYYPETSLDITVKNITDKQYTYYITIEAVDENGARLETDMIYVDRLNASQEIHLKAFEYVEQSKLEQFKNATFKVLEIDKYSF